MTTHNNIQVARNNVFTYDMKLEPGSCVLCEIKLPGSEHNIKIDITAGVYYKESSNRTGLKQSQTESIYTSREDRLYKVILNVPDFPVNKVTKSFILLALDYNNSSYSKTNIEYINIDVIKKEDIDIIGIKNDVQKEQTIKLEQAIQKREINRQSNTICTDKIIFVSTWDINCGIAYYTKDLINDLRRLDDGKYKYLFNINPINNGILEKNITGKLTHLQHEFGVMPKPPSIEGKVIMTWHTIPSNISQTLKIFEDKLDIVGHIVPCEGALEYMKTSKDVHVIGLGSKLIADTVNISKEDARKLLGLDNININKDVDKSIGLVFGFQSVSKNYDRLIKAAKKTDIHLIICGTVHESGYKHPTLLDLSNLDNNIMNKCNVINNCNMLNDDNITITNNRYMSDSDIDLYTIASDLLLFDYLPQNHYSASSAMHRTVGSSRPVICSRINHFSDIEEDKDCLKFNDLEELEEKIKYALDNKEEFGNKSINYARRTSRDEMAKKHIDIYRHYVDI